MTEAIFSASAADRTIWGFGWVVHVRVPYSLSADSDCRSANDTGTASTVFGWKRGRMLAKAVTTRATRMAAAARPANIGRATGLRIGRLKPKRGFAAGAASTRFNADATSIFSSGAASIVATARASSAIPLYRAWQAAQST